MSESAAANSAGILQIKVTLMGTKPPIWRRLLVPEDLTFAQFHHVLQIAMGWQNSHLHEFTVGRQRLGAPEPASWSGGMSAAIDERKVRLSHVLEPGSKARYTYDFGDSWEHAIAVEKTVPRDPDAAYPRCVDGELSGPPEDCGGLPGFYDFLDAIRDPSHSEHQEMLDWIGGHFDPEAFSADAVNRRLDQKFGPKSAVKRAATTPKAKKSPIPIARTAPEDAVLVELNDRERRLILEHTFADEELTQPLLTKSDSATYVYRFDDLDDLAGYVAAEANHAKNRKLQKELDALYDRLAEILKSRK